MKYIHDIFKRPKYYFIFPVVVVALFGTSLVKVECPICGGTGSLSQSIGMEDVRVISVDSRILSSEQDACTNYIVTTTDPIINISNVGDQDAQGYLVLHLVDNESGQVLASRELTVEAASQADVVLHSEVTFAYNSIDKPPEEMSIQAEVLLDNSPCIACSGTGKISLNVYLLTKAYKETFIADVINQQEYGSGDWVVINGQNVQVGSKEWLDWMELD